MNTTRTRRVRPYLLAMALAIVSLAPSRAQQPSDGLEWPAITSQAKPWTRWWWLGSIVNERDLTSEMEKYQRAGLGGLELTPIYGVKGYEDRALPYLSPKWMAMLDHTLKEAGRLGLGVDMATGTGWPFGGPQVGDEESAKYFASRSWTVRGGERLAEPVAMMQKPFIRGVTRKYNPGDSSAAARTPAPCISSSTRRSSRSMAGSRCAP